MNNSGSSQYLHDDELDDEEMTDGSGLLGDKKQEQNSFEVPCCGWMSVRYYQPYFDVDTADVKSRLFAALFFCKSEPFMTIVANKPDAYGPVWVSSSLVFSLAVTSHISSWMAARATGAAWEYDFESVISLASLVYGFLCFVSAALYFTMRQIEASTSPTTVLCVYGYSLTIFIPASVVLILPYDLLDWVVLLAAAASSGLFLTRSFGPIVVQYAPARATALVTAIGAVPLLFIFILKVFYF